MSPPPSSLFAKSEEEQKLTCRPKDNHIAADKGTSRQCPHEMGRRTPSYSAKGRREMLRRREPKRIRDRPDGCLPAGEELLRLSYPARDEVGMRREPCRTLERLGKRRLGYSEFVSQLRDPIVFAGMLGHAPSKLREALRRLGWKHPRRLDNRHQKVKRRWRRCFG